eukprot:6174134-Pleurochrysis_carterae.AAC.3
MAERENIEYRSSFIWRLLCLRDLNKLAFRALSCAQTFSECQKSCSQTFQQGDTDIKGGRGHGWRMWRPAKAASTVQVQKFNGARTPTKVHFQQHF